jgi:hypothetical protein
MIIWESSKRKFFECQKRKEGGGEVDFTLIWLTPLMNISLFWQLQILIWECVSTVGHLMYNWGKPAQSDDLFDKNCLQTFLSDFHLWLDCNYNVFAFWLQQQTLFGSFKLYSSGANVKWV